MKNQQPPFYHMIRLDEKHEQIATQAASETGLTVTEYLQARTIYHLEHIEPTQDTSERKYEFNPPG